MSARRVVWGFIAGGAIALVAATLGYWRMQGQASAAAPAPPAVTVVAVRAGKADVPVYFDGIGTVTPLRTVTVHARVDGELMRVFFREGEEVRKGQLIALLDPRPFRVQLLQAQGQLVRDTAFQGNAERDLRRYQALLPQEAVPQQQVATQASLVGQYAGVVKSDRAAIANARLQLAYCSIRSPLNGRVGLRLVDPGNIVHVADAGGLVVITEVDPITVVFPLPEDRLPEVTTPARGERALPVTALDRTLERTLAVGSLLAVDNQVDPATGTVRLKAIFDNGKRTLFPNQFVNARLLVRTLRDAVTMPSTAVQHGPRGDFAYVVGPGQLVEVRALQVGPSSGGQSAIERGLATGEWVVVEGSERLRPGAKVTLAPPRATPGEP